MKSKMIVSMLLVLWCLLSSVAIAGNHNNPGIAPHQSSPHGQTYGEWAASWWQWAIGTPFTGHPLSDIFFGGETDCSVGQTGHVWFLGGTFGFFPGHVRECTVPTGTALFFPIINAASFAFLNDPEDERTEEFIREQVACDNYILHAEIDGVEVKMPEQYLTMSPLFDVQLQEDNIFGAEEGEGPDQIPELLLSPSVDQGVYLFVRPLSRGEHTIYFAGSQDCPFGSFTDGVTYNITVEPRNNVPVIPLLRNGH